MMSMHQAGCLFLRITTNGHFRCSYPVITCIRAVRSSAVVRIRWCRLLNFSHGSPLLLPHLHLRLCGPGAHVRHVSFLALRAVPVRSPLPVLYGLLTKPPVSGPASRGPLVTPLAHPALHVIVLRLGTLLHGMHLHTVTVVTSRTLWDRFHPSWGSRVK